MYANCIFKVKCAVSQAGASLSCFVTTEKNNPINTMRYMLLSTREVGGVQWEMGNIALTVLSLWFYTKIALLGEILNSLY